MSNEELDHRRNGELNGSSDQGSLVKTGAGENDQSGYAAFDKFVYSTYPWL